MKTYPIEKNWKIGVFFLIVLAMLIFTVKGAFAEEYQTINDSKIYISALSEIKGSGIVPITFIPKFGSANIDIAFGFDEKNTNPIYLELLTNTYNETFGNDSYITRENWTRKNPTSLINYDYDGKNKWYVFQNWNVQVNKTYQARMYLEVLDSGKYDVALKLSSETIANAIANNRFYFLDPTYNVSSNIVDNTGLSYGTSAYPNTLGTGGSFNVTTINLTGKNNIILNEVRVEYATTSPLYWYVFNEEPTYTQNGNCLSANQSLKIANGSVVLGVGNVSQSNNSLVLYRNKIYTVCFDSAGGTWGFKYSSNNLPKVGSSNNITYVHSMSHTTGSGGYDVSMRALSGISFNFYNVLYSESINVSSPLNNSVINSNSTDQVYFNFTILSEDQLNASCNITLNSSVIYSNVTVLNNTMTSYNQSLYNGWYVVNVTCADVVSSNNYFYMNYTAIVIPSQTTAEAIADINNSLIFIALLALSIISYFISLIRFRLDDDVNVSVGSFLLKFASILMIGGAYHYCPDETIRLGIFVFLVLLVFAVIIEMLFTAKKMSY